MNALEEQVDNAKARKLFWKPMSLLGAIRPTSANDAFDPALWATFVSTTHLGVGATKAHAWTVSVLGPLFRTAGHTVRTQHGVTASACQRRGNVEIRSYLRDQVGRRSLVFDLSIAHDSFGSSSHVQQNGNLTHPQDLDGPLRVAAQRKINAYGQQYADNQNISFLPAIMSTSCRASASFCVFIFYRPAESLVTSPKCLAT